MPPSPSAVGSAPASPEPPPLLHLRGVSKRFGGVAALDGVDFAAGPAEVHGVIGANGAGKSTMMKLLSGVYSAYAGEIRVDGATIHFDSPAAAARHGIGMVHQELSTFPHLTVAENISGRHPPRMGGARWGFVDWRAMFRGAAQHLAALGLDIDVTHVMGSLPVGTQQLVEIARVIFSGARVIILDEPTSALSPPETERLLGFIASLKSQGKTILFISHFLEDVLAVADRVTVLRNGRSVVTLRTADTDKQSLVNLMIGGGAVPEGQTAAGAGRAVTEAEAEGRPPTLQARALTKRGAFHDVSFRVDRGEIVGLFAFMGGGQTQLGRCLFGADRLDTGDVVLEGATLKLPGTTRAKASGVAFVPDDRRDSLMMDQAVFKNITLAHLGRLFGVRLQRESELEIARAQIQRLGVRPPNPLLRAGALSGGNQQKVVLGKWLTRKPRLLILNEPTRGMDVGAKQEVMNIVASLRDEGVAILLITTEPEMILSMADRALVMRKGRLTADLRGTTLTKESLMSHA